MRKLLFCFILVISSAVAAPITASDVICNGSDLGPNGACLGFSVSVEGPSNSPVSESLQDNYLFTVVAGPEHGFVAPCLDGEAFGAGGGMVFGSAGFSASFLGAGIGGPFGTTGVAGLAGCGFGGSNFTLGVPIETQLSLSAFGTGAFGAAMASVFGLEFFDASMNPVSDVMFSLGAVPTPEPSAPLSLVCGLLLIAVVRHRQSS